VWGKWGGVGGVVVRVAPYGAWGNGRQNACAAAMRMCKAWEPVWGSGVGAARVAMW